MPTGSSRVRHTNGGVGKVEESRRRLDAAKEPFEATDKEPKQRWGQGDAVVVGLLRNDETAGKQDPGLASLGAIRSKGSPALTEDEYRRLIPALLELLCGTPRPDAGGGGLPHRKGEVVRTKVPILVVVCALVLASSVLAQTKISGSIDCDKGDPKYMIAVPDREGFAFVIDQTKCTWPKHTPIEGLQAKEFTNVRFVDVSGASARTTAAGVTLYDNGDKLFTRSLGSSKVKELTNTGKWTITGGTGKLQGLKGGGTYTCKMKSTEPGSGYTCDIDGEYTVPAAKK